jgi:sialate O-acetylesterase
MSREALAPWPEKIAQGAQYADYSLREKTIADANHAQWEWGHALRQSDAGLVSGVEYFRPDTDDSQWGSVNLPGSFDQKEALKGFCGVLWLRRSFTLSETLANRFAEQNGRVWLGTITDGDVTFINGQKVGEITYRYPPRKYPLPPGLLHPGENNITIRVVCNNGEGGVTPDKPFCITMPDAGIQTEIVSLAGQWRYQCGPRQTPCPPGFFIQWQPMGFYNAMIAPALGVTMRGALFYQGESNDSQPAAYEALFKAMIQCWREEAQKRRPLFMPSETPLPFIAVQLPLFGALGETEQTNSWAIIREAQATALELPDTGLACALDLGEWNDLHPLNKKTLGERLALAAEKLVYGADEGNDAASSPGPLLRSIERDGNKALLRFDNCGAGLAIRSPFSAPGAGAQLDETLSAQAWKPYLTLVSSSGAMENKPVRLAGKDCLEIDLNGTDRPVKLFYAWAANPLCRFFYNSAGLPMLPFQACL